MFAPWKWGKTSIDVSATLDISLLLTFCPMFMGRNVYGANRLWANRSWGEMSHCARFRTKIRWPNVGCKPNDMHIPTTAVGCKCWRLQTKHRRVSNTWTVNCTLGLLNGTKWKLSGAFVIVSTSIRLQHCSHTHTSYSLQKLQLTLCINDVLTKYQMTLKYGNYINKLINTFKTTFHYLIQWYWHLRTGIKWTASTMFTAYQLSNHYRQQRCGQHIHMQK